MSGPPPLPPGAVPDVSRIDTTEGLNAGDVVQISVKLTDKRTGDDFWWRRFAVVMRQPVSRHLFEALTLKMHPDMDKDKRVIDTGVPADEQVVTKLAEHTWPQGVIAMRMKALTLGWVRLT